MNEKTYPHLDVLGNKSFSVVFEVTSQDKNLPLNIDLLKAEDFMNFQYMCVLLGPVTALM